MIKYGIFIANIILPVFLISGCATASPKESAGEPSSKEQSSPEVKKDSAEKSEKEQKKESREKQTGDKKEDSKEESGEKPEKDAKIEKKKKEPDHYDGLKYNGPAEKPFSEGLGKYFTDGCSAAVDEWKKALEKDPERYQIAFNIALCYQRMNKSDESREWFEKSFQINPEFTRPLY
ncbi:MAG TPA: tetratricopeptide repeat protein, partial [bacterium]|nr:tetratricopeptide repeat protein [bacterium]